MLFWTCWFKSWSPCVLVRLGHVTTLRSNSINSAGFLKSPLSISLYLLRFARHWCVKLISLSLAEVGRVTLYKTWTQVERCHEADSQKKKNERKFKINCAMVFHLMVFWLDDESPARVVSFKIGSKPAWLPLVYVADACTVCWRRRLLSVVLKRPELLPTCQDWRMEDYCVSECAISSSACCLCCVCLCQCVSLCLCSSETLPDPPVFVFAPRAPLHFAFTEGKPCVKMQLTPFPQQDAQQERANTDSHFPCARLYNVSNPRRSHKAFKTLLVEDMTYSVSRKSSMSGGSLVPLISHRRSWGNLPYLSTLKDFPKHLRNLKKTDGSLP